MNMRQRKQVRCARNKYDIFARSMVKRVKNAIIDAIVDAGTRFKERMTAHVKQVFADMGPQLLACTAAAHAHLHAAYHSQRRPTSLVLPSST